MRRNNEGRGQFTRTSATHRLSQIEAEQRQQRMLYMGAGIFLVLLIALMLAGFLLYMYQPPRTVVAGVGEREFTARDVVPYAKILRAQSGFPATYVGTLPAESLNYMVQSEALQQFGAAPQNIAVSSEEVEDYIARNFNTPVATPTPTPAPTQTSPGADVTPTPDGTPATEPTPTETPAPTPTPTLAALEPEAKTRYEQSLERIGVTDANFREFVRTLLVRQKVQQSIFESIPLVQEQARIRWILTFSEADGKKALERIKAGEPFEAVAKEMNQDTSGLSEKETGLVGWIPRGVIPETDAEIFTPTPGLRETVLLTGRGFLIVEVLDAPQQQPLTPTMRDTQSRSTFQSRFQQWLTDPAVKQPELDNRTMKWIERQLS